MLRKFYTFATSAFLCVTVNLNKTILKTLTDTIRHLTRRLALTTVTALAALATAGAQPICNVERYDENDGLTQWHVTQLLQDNQGMMWFATWNGLCRFDGYEFRGFKGRVGDGESLSTDRIRSIWLNDEGNIGCRVDDSYHVFNLKTYRFSSLSHKGRAKTSGTAVKKDRPYKYKDAEGVTWTIHHDGSLEYQYPGGKPTPYQPSSRIEGAHYCLPDRQGQLWVAGKYAIYKLSFLYRKADMQLNEEAGEVKAFLTDRHRRYWIATKNDAAIRIFDRRNNFVGYLTTSGSISRQYSRFESSVYAMQQTQDGTVWIGMKPGGLLRLKEFEGGGAYRIDKIGGLSHDAVYDMKEDNRGRLWVATLGGGVNCITNPREAVPRVLTPKHGLAGYPQKLAKKTRMIHITRDGVILVATTEGLLAAKLPSDQNIGKMPFRLHTREAGRKDALSCSATMNIAEDSKGHIYISTESGGVNRITSTDLTAEKLSFRHYAKEYGMPTDVALSVVRFGNKMLVVSSNRLILLEPESGSTTSFDRRFFLSAGRFSEARPLQLPDGRWIFGMQDGTMTVAPQHLKKSNFVPNIALTGISIQGEARNLPINAMDTLTLQKTERSLTITFAALDYSPDGDIRYSFSLERENGDGKGKWNDMGHDHSATLLDLDPGHYTFTVRSTNADGLWVDNARQLTIIVTPTFWETTLARFIITLLVIILAGGTAYTILYIRRIRRQRRDALEAYLSLLGTGEKEKQEDSAPMMPEMSDEDDALMRRISTFIETHMADAEVGVGDMADAAAVSRSGLQRKMKQLTGVTPLDFLREARIKNACRLLKSSAMPVSEVAYACGFSDPKYFSRCFKASVGKSPKEYRSGETEE